jgi:cyclohexanone monooxygenase
MDVPHKLALTHLHKQVRDRELRKKLTPDYTIGCKRILISNEFYPALDQPNADVVTSPIQEIRERSIVTQDGTEREVDTIVFATGFQATPPPIAERVCGTGGRTLIEEWRENGMQGYRGTTVAGFPNLFFLVGPNTGLGHTSMVHVIESQIQYVRSAIQTMRERGLASVEPRREAQARWNEGLQERLEGTVWNTGGCASWYLDDAGRNTTLWPGFTFELRAKLRQFDAANYVTTSRTTLPVAPRESMSLSASGA